MLWALQPQGSQTSKLIFLLILLLLNGFHECHAKAVISTPGFRTSLDATSKRSLQASKIIEASKAEGAGDGSKKVNHKYVVNNTTQEGEADDDKSSLSARRKVREPRRRAMRKRKDQSAESQSETTGNERLAANLSSLTGLEGTEALLRNKSIDESVSQAQAMLVARQQARASQEKAVVQQPQDSSQPGSRELNPSVREASHAFRDLILSSSSLLTGKLPKVALLFLTRGDMPLEKTWRVFFESIPLQGNGSTPGWKTLFSLHTHPSIGFTYPSDSLFYGSEVSSRVTVEWGQFSVMAAEVRLFETALDDPLNERFVLLSETCIPIFPATVVWAELLVEGRSRINACANPSDEKDWYNRMGYRQANEMVEQGLERDVWRKSSQWVALTRQHAQLMEEDDLVRPIFERECYIKQGGRFCVADEHYVPTLLSKLQRENETDCTGFLTNVWWDGPYAHPRTWELRDVSRALILKLRRSVNAVGKDAGPCKCDEAIRSAGLVFPDVVNLTAVKQHRHLLQQSAPDRTASQQDSPLSLHEFAEQAAVLQPFSSAWQSLMMKTGMSMEEIEDEAYQESIQVSQRRLLEEISTGLRHDSRGRHWDLAREFLQDYESMNDQGCPLFARKFQGDAHEVLAEMATKLGVLEQAFLAADSSQQS